MSKNILMLFWTFWLLDLLAALLGYREFIGSIFGRYAAPSLGYIAIWVPLFIVILLILGGSIYFKNHEQSSLALSVAAIPLVLALPYALYLAVAMLSGKGRWN